jgi:5-oxoprolinase (ATP-hydrolysing) subunit A
VAAIDLNADPGEGFGVWRLGDDDAMLGIVTSANVACGSVCVHGDLPGAVQIATAMHDRLEAAGADIGAFG